MSDHRSPWREREATGLTKFVLAVLGARGITTAAELCARIDGCADVPGQAALEALKASGASECLSDLAGRYVAEGEAKGLARGKAGAVLAVLTARGITANDELRARILACTDVATIDTWLARAVVAKTAAAVLGE